MPERVKGVQAVESGLHLPGTEGELDAAWRDADVALRAEQRILRPQPLAPRGLVPPEPSELDQQSVRQEHVAGPAVLGDLRPQPDAVLRPAIRGVDISDVQAYDLS